jgi:hypothetical protein
MVVVSLACYSAGTPLLEDWVRPTLLRKPARLTDRPFVARLPQKMLARGALGFVGHVSRAWDYSFLGVEGSDAELATFQALASELLNGRRVGHATDYVNTRWARLTVLLDAWLGAGARTKQQIVALWQARNDGRGYVVLGDPAARVRVELLQ